MKDYVLMQGIKESSTLRVGTKGEKPMPKIVYRFGKQDQKIRKYLEKREEIKKIIRINIWGT
jgi:hypothetical protein